MKTKTLPTIMAFLMALVPVTSNALSTESIAILCQENKELLIIGFAVACFALVFHASSKYGAKEPKSERVQCEDNATETEEAVNRLPLLITKLKNNITFLFSPNHRNRN